MPRPQKSAFLPALLAGTCFSLTAGHAGAAEVAPAPPPPSFWDTFTAFGIIDTGTTLNPQNPPDGINFGHLFTDKANQLLLNQILLTAQRPVDPKATDYDFGFKLQVMYGSDARYTHYLGECDYCINDVNQFTPVELWGQLHLPWVFSGGIDVKAGQFVTLEGSETIDPTTNYTYSKSYIFNFGIPFVETGIMTISHVDPLVDIYAGLVTGVNTTIGYRGGDNNGGVSFHGGIGLNLFDGNLTVLATTHIGPENPDVLAVRLGCGCNPNTALRYLNDITMTWKVNDEVTFITDANFIRDDGFKASGYGVAQYGIYTVNDWLKLVGRVEVWRDNNNFFVAAFPNNFSFVNAEYGFNNVFNPITGSFITTGIIPGPAPTTYFEITGGLNISPPIPKGTPYIQALTIRPEIRWDSSLNGTTPFDGTGAPITPLIPPFGNFLPPFGTGTRTSQFTFGGDIILKFGT